MLTCARERATFASGSVLYAAMGMSKSRLNVYGSESVGLIVAGSVIVRDWGCWC